MPSYFDITAPTNEVLLDEERKGDISFTVRNRTGADVEARASVVVEPPASADWIEIVGAQKRSFAVNGNQRFLLEVEVPGGTPEGTYIFRLDVASVALPDEHYAEGPATSFFVPVSEAPPPPPPPPEPRGYLVTLCGALIGGAALATLFALLSWFGTRSARADNLGGVIVSVILVFLATLFGFWLGAVVGSWLALRIKRYHSQISTALILGGVLIVVGGLLLGLLFSFGDGLGGFASILVLVITIALAIGASAFGARGIVIFRRTGHV